MTELLPFPKASMRKTVRRSLPTRPGDASKVFGLLIQHELLTKLSIASELGRVTKNVSFLDAKLTTERLTRSARLQPEGFELRTRRDTG
jgi:hypothetical protein